MFRFLLVRGVRGQLVANPHVDPQTRRFLGKSLPGPRWDEGPPDPETGKPRWARSEVIEEVVQDAPDGTLRKAIKGGGIVLVRECVAPSLAAARKALQPPTAPTRAEK